MERKWGRREPYRDLARYVHVLATKPGWASRLGRAAARGAWLLPSRQRTAAANVARVAGGVCVGGVLWWAVRVGRRAVREASVRATKVRL